MINEEIGVFASSSTSMVLAYELRIDGLLNVSSSANFFSPAAKQYYDVRILTADGSNIW